MAKVINEYSRIKWPSILLESLKLLKIIFDYIPTVFLTWVEILNCIFKLNIEKAPSLLTLTAVTVRRIVTNYGIVI